jgi:ferric enterobactin receptor
VLRHVPALDVDIDGSVRLRGNQRVVIQLNGRTAPLRGQQLALFLQQLPASMLDRVEVIPNPSARHDPDGMAGIVNIVLKQSADLGTSGGGSLGLATGGRSSGSGNLGYQRGRVTLFGSYGYLDDRRDDVGSNYRELRSGAEVPYLEQAIASRLAPRSHSLTGNADLRLGRTTVLSASALLSIREHEQATRNEHVGLDGQRAAVYRHGRVSDVDNHGRAAQAGLTLQHTLRPREHELSADLRLSRSVNDIHHRFAQYPHAPEGVAQSAPERREAHRIETQSSALTAQVDYTRSLPKGLRMEAGYKATLRQLDNALGVSEWRGGADGFADRPERSNAFRFDEQIHAGYTVLTAGRGRVQAQGGLRMEHAETDFALADAGVTANGYSQLFPSASLAYSRQQGEQLKASYTKRIQRPDAAMLNPFVVADDPSNLLVGNPHLRPEYTHAFELSYVKSGSRGSLQLTPYFRRSTDVIRRIKEVGDDGVSVTTYRNLSTSDSYGADVTGSWKVGALSGFLGWNLFQMSTDASNLSEGLSVGHASSWSVRGSMGWKVDARTDAQVLGMYRAPLTVEQGWISGVSMLQLALRRKVLNDKGSISLRVTDPLDTMGFSFWTADERHYQESHRHFRIRSVHLGFSYSVGQQPRVRRLQADPEQNAPDLGIR